VRDTWLTESLRCKRVQDTDAVRFRVPGAGAFRNRMSKNADQEGHAVTDGSEGNRGDYPSGGRTKTGNRREILINPPQNNLEINGLTATCDSDDLDAIVQEVKHLEYLVSRSKPVQPQEVDMAQPVDRSWDDTGHSSPEASTDAPDTGVKGDAEGWRVPKENVGFQCMEKHEGKNDNPNARTIEILQEMAAYYHRTGDLRRPIAYRKAIAALRRQKHLIRTKEDAMRISTIGERLAVKIEEIVTTDRLRCLENTSLEPEDQALQLFIGIYGVGFRVASRWVAQGFRTLDDLRNRANLTANQRIGIDHYNDFSQRIPRREVAWHADIVRSALRAADENLEMIIAGSYRRGHMDSGDIDILITKPGASMEHIRTLVLRTVVPKLTRQGFLKAALASGSSEENGSKWHGASALPGSVVWRRLDLLFVPWDELGAALIYFTGNDIFNRSLRLLASRKHMRLNQHGLYADVMRGRGRERITDGRLLESHDERRIFEILKVPYRPPEHRRC